MMFRMSLGLRTLNRHKLVVVMEFVVGKSCLFSHPCTTSVAFKSVWLFGAKAIAHSGGGHLPCMQPTEFPSLTFQVVPTSPTRSDP